MESTDFQARGFLKTLCGAGPISIREAARRVGRDVKAVHGDVTALLDAGVIDRDAGGGIEFPYESVKIEFLLRAPSSNQGFALSHLMTAAACP